MRKTAATIFILGVVWIGYTAWPLYDLLVLVRAIETRDVETVTRHVYFDAVRMSLTDQLVAAYVRHTGTQISPLAQSMAASALGVADPVVKKLISPEALSDLLAVGWPVAVLPDPPPDRSMTGGSSDVPRIQRERVDIGARATILLILTGPELRLSR